MDHDGAHGEALTLGGLVEWNARHYGGRPFLKFEGKTVTYTELERRVERIGRGLIACGVEKGDRVALWMGNRTEWLEAYLATVSIGAVLVTVNTRYHADELLYELRQCEAKYLVMERKFLKQELLERALEIAPEMREQPFGEVRCESLPDLRGAVCLEDLGLPGFLSYAQLEARGEACGEGEFARRRSEVTPDDVAIMIYTSGTTGDPKGVEQQHGALVHRMRAFTEWNHETCEDVVFFALPMFHSFGTVVTTIGALVCGSCICLMDKFRAHEALECVQDNRCTVVHGVPTSFLMMLSEDDFDEYDMSSVRTGVLGGAHCDPGLAHRIVERIAPGVSSVYGQTETCGMVTASAPGDDVSAVCDSVGHVMPGSRIFIVDTKTGEELPCGQDGEIVVESDWNMKCYHGMPEKTAEAFDAHGRLKTGDVGHFDENGLLYITGRIRDMFIVGGVNAYPVEIENHIRKLPGVHDAEVAGVPDERLGEVACAWVIREPGSDVTAQDIVDWCHGLANYKVPRYVRFVDSFPETASGKVLKRKLQESFDPQDCA